MPVTQILDQRQRNAQTFTSPSMDASQLPSGPLILRGILPAADLADPTLTILSSIEGTADPAGATGWHILAASAWTGGFTDRAGNPLPPTLSFTGDGQARLRVTVDFPRRLNIGAELETP